MCTTNISLLNETIVEILRKAIERNVGKWYSDLDSPSDYIVSSDRSATAMIGYLHLTQLFREIR